MEIFCRCCDEYQCSSRYFEKFNTGKYRMASINDDIGMASSTSNSAQAGSSSESRIITCAPVSVEEKFEADTALALVASIL